MRWILALVAVTGLSACEFLLDVVEPPMARHAGGADATVAGPEDYGL